MESPAGKAKKRRKAKQEQKPKRQPRYHVVLWNDDHHSYAYVVVMMHDLFSHPPERGYVIAREVDTRGKAIVFTTTLEHAELKRDQIHAFGRDRAIEACKGSMTATLEAET
ncbi:MAG: ATP-dependent Clp protease adaptor ClpS [Planctomycetes bacterium]|nr:ATP-dependent Clp protease adaptor ClpS [Planctomycetota bacterium]